MLQLNVLGPCMINWVVCQLDCTLIVTIYFCGFCFSPTSSRILLNQTTSHVALAMALYSASVDDRETVGCFLLLHDTTPDPMLNA